MGCAHVSLQHGLCNQRLLRQPVPIRAGAVADLVPVLDRSFWP
jgi:hypothetical protein